MDSLVAGAPLDEVQPPPDGAWLPLSLGSPLGQQQQQQQPQNGVAQEGNHAQQQQQVGSQEQQQFQEWAAAATEALSNRLPCRDGGRPCRRAEKGHYTFDSSGRCTAADMRDWCFNTFAGAVNRGQTQQGVEYTLERSADVPALGGDGSFQQNLPRTFKAFMAALQQFGVLPHDYGTVDYWMCNQCGFIYRQVLASDAISAKVDLMLSRYLLLAPAMRYWQTASCTDCVCRGSNEAASQCGAVQCGAIRSSSTTATLKFRPLRRYLEHLLSSEEGRVAVRQWAEQACIPSGELELF